MTLFGTKYDTFFGSQRSMVGKLKLKEIERKATPRI